MLQRCGHAEVAGAFHLSTQGTEAGRTLSLKAVWSGLYSKFQATQRNPVTKKMREEKKRKGELNKVTNT